MEFIGKHRYVGRRDGPYEPLVEAEFAAQQILRSDSTAAVVMSRSRTAGTKCRLQRLSKILAVRLGRARVLLPCVPYVGGSFLSTSNPGSWEHDQFEGPQTVGSAAGASVVEIRHDLFYGASYFRTNAARFASFTAFYVQCTKHATFCTWFCTALPRSSCGTFRLVWKGTS